MRANKRLIEIYGDRLAGELGDDRTELPSATPIVPIDQMATQLSMERPPIEDSEYVPATREELSLAVKEIAMLVPDDQVEMFYRAALSNLEQARDIQNNPGLNEKMPEDPSDFKSPVKAKKVKKESKNIIQKCVNSGESDYIISINNHPGDLMRESNKPLVSNRRGGMRQKDYARKWSQEDDLELSFNRDLADMDDEMLDDEFEFHPDKEDIKDFMEETGEDDSSKVYGSPEYSLKDILSTGMYPGVKGPQGLANKIGRNIFPVLRMTKNAPQLFDRILTLFESDWAMEAYLDAMYHAGYYTEEETEELAANAEATRELESYRYVVQQIIVVPAVKELNKMAKMGKDVFDPTSQKSQISPQDAQKIVDSIKNKWDRKPAARQQVAADRGIEAMEAFEARDKSKMG